MRDGSIPNRSGDRYAPSSIRGYERGLRLRVLPELGHRKLTDNARSDVQDLADRLTGDGLTPSTVLNTLDPLRRIYDRAIKRDLVSIDPTDGLELRRPKGRRERIAAPEEAARLLAALPDDLRALYATAMYAGLRRGELRALRWGDVDLAARRIRVQRGWTEGEREEVKSDAGRRIVPILDLLAGELAGHGLRTTRAGDDLVFGRLAREAFNPSTVRRHAGQAWEVFNAQIRKAAQERGEDIDRAKLLEPIGLHESRHCFASMLIASGANAKVIQSVMGHATIQMTFYRHGHLMPGGLTTRLLWRPTPTSRPQARPGRREDVDVPRIVAVMALEVGDSVTYRHLDDDDLPRGRSITRLNTAGGERMWLVGWAKADGQEQRLEVPGEWPSSAVTQEGRGAPVARRSTPAMAGVNRV